MSGTDEMSREVDIDIAGLLGEVWKKKWVILIISAIFGGMIFLGSSMVSPRYKTSASILIEKSKSYLAREKESLNLSSDLDQDAIGSQVQLIMSDSVALAVIDKLGLAENGELSSQAKPSLLGSIFGGASDGPSPDEKILKAFKERLQVYSALNSRMIKVEYWAHSPAMAQKIANAIGEEYMSLMASENMSANDEAKKYLAPEIAELKAKVEAAQQKVADFRATSDMALGANNAYLATQQLSEVSTELSRTRAERATAEATIGSIRKALKTGTSLDAVPDVISNPLIQRLLERQVNLRAQISDLSASLLPNHPKLKALKSQLSDYDKQIRLTAGNILKSLESNVSIARQRETDLNAEVSRLKLESVRVGDAEVELNALKRDAEVKEQQLKERMASFGQANSSVTANTLPVSAKFFPASKPSEHYFPKVIPFTIAGIVVSMILSIVGILAWALLTGKAFKEVGEFSSEMVPAQVQMPNVAVQPAMTAQAPVVHQAYAPPAHPVPMQHGMNMASAPAMVTPFNPQHGNNTVSKTDLLSALSTFNYGVIASISPGSPAGSSETVQLARNLAEMGRSVVVVDLSGTGVVTISMLGTDQVPGVYEILSGVHVVDTAVYCDRASKCHVVASGMEQKQPDGYTLNRLKNTMKKLQDNYEFVIVDCGLVNIQSLSKFGGTDTIVVINTLGADMGKCLQLEQTALQSGYMEVITLAAENTGIQSMAA